MKILPRVAFSLTIHRKKRSKGEDFSKNGEKFDYKNENL